MASTLVFPVGFRLLDTSGNPVSGGKAKFYNAGTSTPKVVYSDATLSTSLGSTVYTRSDGQFVASEGSSTTVAVFTGEDSYKLELTTSADVVLFGPFDNLVGAPALTPAEQVAPFVSVTTTGSNVTLDADDRGTLLNCSGNTVTFPAAATLGDGFWCYVKNAASAGTGRVVLSAASGISYQGTSPTTIYLEPGQCLGITCDGTAYRVFSDAILYSSPAFRPNTPGVIVIADRITAEPSTSIGSRYIVSTGYGSFATHDIVTEVASGVFVGTTPPTDCGWVAYVQDEDRYYAFKGSAWVDILNTIRAADMPAGSTINRAYDDYTTNTDISTVIPLDDTIPQNTEGTEILSASITLTKSTNRVRARFQGFGECNNGGTGNTSAWIAALFIGGTANALSAGINSTEDAEVEDASFQVILEFEHAPGSVGPLTYSIRVGPAAGTLRMNGTTAARYFGGVATATLVLEEIQV
jgi:hypothetical protein